MFIVTKDNRCESWCLLSQ